MEESLKNSGDGEPEEVELRMRLKFFSVAHKFSVRITMSKVVGIFLIIFNILSWSFFDAKICISILAMTAFGYLWWVVVKLYAANPYVDLVANTFNSQEIKMLLKIFQEFTDDEFASGVEFKRIKQAQFLALTKISGRKENEN